MTDTCAQCGHPLGVGRYCTNCGHLVDPSRAWRTDTAERPAVREEVRPEYAGAPPAPRFPLFADEVLRPVPPAAPPAPAPVPAPDPPRGRGVLLWLVGAVVVVVVAALGLHLLTGTDSGSGTSSGNRAGEATRPTGTGRPSPDTTPSADPSISPRAGRTPNPAPTRPTDVARFATAAAPGTAPPGRDVRGNVVRYVPFNMLDGVTSTAWRTPGDGTGDLILITLDRPTTLTSVGMINGYAKSEPGYDGYLANRRITSVQWTFDDGTTIPQSLATDRSMQSVDVPGVRTRTVRLRIIGVSRPGPGRTGRDYTAISDLSIVGR